MTTQEYNECVSEYADPLLRFILKNLGDRFEAENIVQNTFEKMWVRRDAVQYETAKSYMFRTAYNNMIDVIRKNKRNTSLEAAGEVAAQEHAYSDVTRWVNKAVEQLPENQRAAITLRDFEGYDYRSIGEITGMSESAVKVNIFRARKFIKTYLEKLNIEAL